MRVALVTCADLPDLDEDDRVLRAALPESEPVVWNDPRADWDAYDLVVLREPWDYILHHRAFLNFCDRIGEKLLNPPAVIHWNTDKRYLADLDAAGIPVVPTTFLEPGAPMVLGGWDAIPCVVKPSISAGSQNTARHDHPRAAMEHAHALLDDGHVVMVQPYLAEVESAGETALLYFEGEFSHAIRKGPLLSQGAAQVDGLFAPEAIEPRDPRPEELAVGARVMAEIERRFGGPLLYARVDLLGTDPVVLELELTEPSLFFLHADGAAERFAAAIRARIP